MRVVLPLGKDAPEQAGVHFRAARARAETGKIEDAKEHVRQVSMLAPELREELLECEDSAAPW